MTSERYRGTNSFEMRRCELRDSNRYYPAELALRDMRQANGRDPETGLGDPNESWASLCLSMIILDVLSRQRKGKQEDRWVKLLIDHSIPELDARIIYALRNSLLHEYFLPTYTGPDVGILQIVLTGDRNGYAVDTSGVPVLVSAPVFCGSLVEHLAFVVPISWTKPLVDTNYFNARGIRNTSYGATGQGPS
jgi:hypothetical protein